MLHTSVAQKYGFHGSAAREAVSRTFLFSDACAACPMIGCPDHREIVQYRMLPKVLERKLTLSDDVQTYICELLSLEGGVGILRYVIDRTYDVSGFRLSPGDVTLALYWEGRPYTLYVWFRIKEKDWAYYFNVADSVRLSPAEFLWRDLAVDILVGPAGNATVLDEEELPPNLAPDLAAYITRARDHVLGHFRDILKEADEILRARRLLPRMDTDKHG